MLSSLQSIKIIVIFASYQTQTALTCLVYINRLNHYMVFFPGFFMSVMINFYFTSDAKLRNILYSKKYNILYYIYIILYNILYYIYYIPKKHVVTLCFYFIFYSKNTMCKNVLDNCLANLQINWAEHVYSFAAGSQSFYFNYFRTDQNYYCLATLITRVLWCWILVIGGITGGKCLDTEVWLLKQGF